MSGKYRGETDAKRISRAALMEMLWTTCPGWDQTSQLGRAVVLAGDCGDLRMRRALGWPADRIVCVDLDPGRVDRAREVWPEVKTERGDIRDVVERLPRSSISLAILDFCGHLNDVVQDAVKLAGARLQVNGCLSLTYLRGREALHTPQLKEARLLKHELRALGVQGVPGLTEMESSRRAYAQLVIPWIQKAHSDLAHAAGRRPMEVSCRQRAWVNYHSGKSPMGILLVQLTRMSADMLRGARSFTDSAVHPGFAFVRGGEETVAVRDIPKTHDYRSLIRAGVLQRSGVDASVLADIWNLPAGTVAAWRAVQTMQKRKRMSTSTEVH